MRPGRSGRCGRRPPGVFGGAMSITMTSRRVGPSSAALIGGAGASAPPPAPHRPSRGPGLAQRAENDYVGAPTGLFRPPGRSSAEDRAAGSNSDTSPCARWPSTRTPRDGAAKLMDSSPTLSRRRGVCMLCAGRRANGRPPIWGVPVARCAGSRAGGAGAIDPIDARRARHADRESAGAGFRGRTADSDFTAATTASYYPCA